MIVFVIEDAVMFDPVENILTSRETGEQVRLSLSASRLLETLIQCQGNVLARELIFTEIFDRYGTVSTNNNLNQYILTLRKHFSYLGISVNIIETVPRIGFMIPGSVRVETQETNSADDTAVAAEAITPQAKPSPQRQKNNHYLSGFYLLLLIAINSYMYFNYEVYSRQIIDLNNIQLTQTVKIDNTHGCSIMLIPPGISMVYTPEDYLASVENFREMQCDQNQHSRLYFYRNARADEKSRTFVLKCNGQKDGPSCFSRYTSMEGKQK